MNGRRGFLFAGIRKALVLGAGWFAVGATGGAGARAAETDSHALLAAAEAASSGTAGAVDWPKALRLFEQAVATGDPVASGRWATLEHLGREGLPRDRAAARRRAVKSIGAVRAAAATGDAEAEFVLGSLSLFGLGTAIDDAAAARWYELSSSKGNPFACHNRAWMHETGRGGPVDVAAAEAGYRKCAERGIAPSMTTLGSLGYNALAGKMPAAEAVAWFLQGAERGDLVAAQSLGSVLLYGNRVRADRAAAMKWLKSASDRGDSGATYDLAFAELTSPAGDGRTRGAAALERASIAPHARAMVQLGWLKIVDAQNEAQAREGWEWIDRAATYGLDQFAFLFGVESDGAAERALLASDLATLRRKVVDGSASAQALLARFLFQDLGEGESDSKSYIALARAAAAKGEKHAMRLLGQAHGGGWGVEKDRAVALEWYRKGAAAGESFCMMWLSQILMQGKEVATDVPGGLRWLERSAELGNYWALGDLAHLFDEGWYGLPRDPQRALELKRKRAELGDTEAIGWLRFHSPDDAP